MPTRGMALQTCTRVLPLQLPPGQGTNIQQGGCQQSHIQAGAVPAKSSISVDSATSSLSLGLQLSPHLISAPSLRHMSTPSGAITDSPRVSPELCAMPEAWLTLLPRHLLTLGPWLDRKAEPGSPSSALQTCSHTLGPQGDCNSASCCNSCLQREVTCTFQTRDDCRLMWAQNLWGEVEMGQGAGGCWGFYSRTKSCNRVQCDAEGSHQSFLKERRRMFRGHSSVIVFLFLFSLFIELSLWLSFKTFSFSWGWITLCLLCEESDPLREDLWWLPLQTQGFRALWASLRKKFSTL